MTCDDVQLDFSEYFMYNVISGYGNPDCNLVKMTDDSYKMVLNFENKEIPDMFAPTREGAFIRVQVNSNQNAVFHWMKYDATCIWSFYQEYIAAHSRADGVITPRNVKGLNSNRNQTVGFKGPRESVLEFQLTPSHYVSE